MVVPPAWRDEDPARRPHLPICLATLAAFVAVGAGAPAWAETPDFVTVVLAEPDPPEAADEAASSSVIGPDRTPRAFESLPQLLAEQPGVSLTRSGGLGDFATVSLRGSAPNQVEVFVDGVPASGASVAGVDVGLLGLGQEDYAEIYRGQTPLWFPASGIGGVVALTSARPTRSQVGGSLGWGSFQTRHGRAHLAWASRQASVAVEGQGLAAKNDFPYWNDGGTFFNPADDGMATRQNNAVKQGDGRVRAEVALGPGRRLTAIASGLARERGIPSQGFLAARLAHLSTRQGMATLFYESTRDLGDHSRWRAQTYALGARQRLFDPLAEVTAVATDTNDRTLLVGSTLSGQKLAWPWLRLGAVAGGQHEAFRPGSQEASTGPAGTRDSGLFGVEAELLPDQGAWRFLPSFRLEVARDAVAHREAYDPNQFTATAPITYVEPVARFSVQRRLLPALQVRGNVGRYGRLPSLYERYGNTGQVLGNSDLVPEHGLNADLGLRWDHQTERARFALDVAVFGARVTDLIVFQRAGELLRPINIKGARVLGVEAAWHGQVGRHLRFVAQGTFTDARDASGRRAEQGHQLPLRPRLRGYARPELRALPLGRDTLAGAFADVDLTGQNYLDGVGMHRIPTRVRVGAGIYLEAPRLGLRLLANVENLANAATYDYAGYPLPGRAFFLTLSFRSLALRQETPS